MDPILCSTLTSLVFKSGAQAYFENCGISLLQRSVILMDSKDKNETTRECSRYYLSYRLNKHTIQAIKKPRCANAFILQNDHHFLLAITFTKTHKKFKDLMNVRQCILLPAVLAIDLQHLTVAVTILV